MSRSRVAVLDFGSSKITVLVGNKNQGNMLNVVANGMSDYAGFMDGEFLEPSTLQNSIFEALAMAEKTIKKRIKKLYVGVPAEFSYNLVQPLEAFYPTKTRIRLRNIDKLFNSKSQALKSDSHTIVSETAIHYTLDDGRKVQDAINEVTTSLHALASFVFVDNVFINLISGALEQIGVKNVEFIPASLAESLYLIDKADRENSAILIDTGYITSSVVQAKNNGLLDLKSFSLGGGHITSDLSELLKIPFYSAEQLKRKIVLSLDAKPSDYYEAIVDNKIRKFGAKTVNDIALARIDMIGDAIKKCFEDFSANISVNAKVFLTGGGISYIKGIKDYMTKYIGVDIELVSPLPLMYNKPDLSSEMSLLTVALDMEDN